MTIEPTAIISDDGKTDQNITKDGQALTVKMLLMDNIGDTADRDAAYEAYKKTITDGWRSALTRNPDSDPDEDACPEADVRDAAYDSYVRTISDGWRSGSLGGENGE